MAEQLVPIDFDIDKQKSTEDVLIYSKGSASEFGKRCGYILAMALGQGGLYNVPGAQRLDWSSPRGPIEVKYRGYLATFDADTLTRFVVLCHRLGVRGEINPHTFNSLLIRLHARSGRSGPMWDRHPDLEEAVERLGLTRLKEAVNG